MRTHELNRESKEERRAREREAALPAFIRAKPKSERYAHIIKVKQRRLASVDMEDPERPALLRDAAKLTGTSDRRRNRADEFMS